MKRRILWLLLLIQCLLLSGCWSSSAIEDLNMEVGVALDIADETEVEEKLKAAGGSYPQQHRFSCTFQFIVPQGAVGSKKEGSQSKNFYNMTETGDSVFEAVRELSLRTNRVPIGHHMKIIIIGEKLARTVTLSELTDFFSRDNDIRPSVLLLVSKGKARDVLNNALPGQTPAFVVEGIFGNQNRNSRIWQPVPLTKVLGPLHSKSSFVLQNIISSGSESKFAGVGVIKGKTGLLGGFLDESQLEGLIWLTGKGQGGFLKTKDPETGKLLNYEIKSMDSTIKANVKDGEISFEVKVESAGRFAEVFDPGGERLDEAIIRRKEKVLQDHAEGLIRGTMNQIQHELHADVAGFGTSLRIHHPAIWRKVKEDWDETFSAIPVTYKVKLNIEEYGASGTSAE
ncbi:germination protein BC [Paenibacillus albidus]|uniref:Germination protein BC n=1 Tax=Paenibacillus albidus TaxID=2041023 RepID=A0A917FQ34_9BACL|nr:Ger(x)C family spore germination protein [Paenibacillus albidus]GGF94047.1 germination protein BC [Paenibacillus albidus]